MNYNKINFFKDTVCINLLAKDIANAKEAIDALDGHGLVGIISKQFESVEQGVEYVSRFLESIPLASIGLGDGDPKQWKMAAEIAAETDPGHVNQVFGGASYTLGLLRGKGCSSTLVNALISPTGQPGMVKISTGPFSSKEKEAIVDVNTAMAMFNDTGIQSVKFFHMKGTEKLDELAEVAKACVKHNIPIIEPTGGITIENVKPIIETCLEAGCTKIMPHVYSSLIDKETGLTDTKLVKELYQNIKGIFS